MIYFKIDMTNNINYKKNIKNICIINLLDNKCKVYRKNVDII